MIAYNPFRHVADLFGGTDGQLTFVPDDRTVDRNLTRPVGAAGEERLREDPRAFSRRPARRCAAC